MGGNRKLQGEIDQLLKKVQEGVCAFDSIGSKVCDTDSAYEKEEVEADLKKETERLQISRNQIKTWIESSKIKDKKVSASYGQALMDGCKLIDRQLEQFKIYEEVTKKKSLSEGWQQQSQTDPKEKHKSETILVEQFG